ncbi:uncharacterized protein LOC119820906 isoform X2 [Arvicola amphibius]|uniref:uncharacterized protein LOC119820906 isoform X2 n=1 Tax=Arvicola amphibius TaxID=1047088 RepID=UPI0018E2F90D|nr:uncharacterized protein LOC119820906 isoform X2 [Arvicola amphibius]
MLTDVCLDHNPPEGNHQKPEQTRLQNARLTSLLQVQASQELLLQNPKTARMSNSLCYEARTPKNCLIFFRQVHQPFLCGFRTSSPHSTPLSSAGMPDTDTLKIRKEAQLMYPPTSRLCTAQLSTHQIYTSDAGAHASKTLDWLWSQIDGNIQRYPQLMKIQIIRDCGMLSPKLDIYITPLIPRLRSLLSKNQNKKSQRPQP